MKKVTKVSDIDQELPRTEVQLADGTYYLAFTFPALATAASKLRDKGVKCNLLQSLDLSTLNADQVIPLLYAALITHQPDITFEKVTEICTLKSLGNVFEGIAAAYSASLANPNEKLVNE
jgi:hypothetical protein